MRKPADPRREARGSRITTAVCLMALATAVLGTSLVLRQPLLVGAAGVVAVVLGWISLRLVWTTVLLARREHAAARTELARSYRGLFAERGVEQAELVETLTGRLAHRNRRIDDLQTHVVGIEMRTVEAESAARVAEGRLEQVGAQITALEQLVIAGRVEFRPVVPRPSGAAAPDSVGEAPPVLRGLGRDRDESRPQWTALEPDLVSSLMSWEKHAQAHAQEVARQIAARRADSGRHAAG